MEQAEALPYQLEFTLSASTTGRIFALTQQANYFSGNFEDAAHRPGRRAIKTLSYGEGPAKRFGHVNSGVRNVAVYDYTHNMVILQLTSLFEELAQTVELGRRLDHLRRANSLQLAGELHKADVLAHQERLPDLEIIAESLRGVAEDPGLAPAARRQAQDLLTLARAS